MDPSLLLTTSLALFLGAALLLILTLVVAGYTYRMIQESEAKEQFSAKHAETPDFSHLRSGEASRPMPMGADTPPPAAEPEEEEEEDVDDMETEVFNPGLIGTTPAPKPSTAYTLGGKRKP